MKIKNNVEFESFNDGVCTIYSESRVKEGDYNIRYSGLGFSKRVMGIQRHFIADAYHKKVDKVIRIPIIPIIEEYDIVKIDKTLYSIELIQELKDTNPPSYQLNMKICERNLTGNLK